MKRVITTVLCLTMVVLAAGMVGCSKKASTSEVVTPPVKIEPARPADTTPTGSQEQAESEMRLQPAFFDYDMSSIRADAAEVLTHNAKMMVDNPNARVLIEGHCDERGTREYNMALGDRRASAARDFLVRFGIEPGRIETISYGKERPFNPAQNERSWQENRRAHFVLK